MTDETPPLLLVALDADAAGRAVKAVVEALGDSAVRKFCNMVRLLDQRVTRELRTIEAIAEEQVRPLGIKDQKKTRKRLEFMARTRIQRIARELASRHERPNEPFSGTALIAVAQEILRAHGYVDVLQEWLAGEQRRTSGGRAKAQGEAQEKNAADNKAIKAEAETQGDLSQRRIAKVVAHNVKGKKGVNLTTDAVRGRLRRRNSQPKSE